MNQIKGIALSAAVIALCAPATAWANSFTDAEIYALKKTVAAYEVDMREGDAVGALVIVPNKIYLAAAQLTGSTRNEVIRQTMAEMKQVFEQFEFVEFAMTPDEAQANTAANGKPYLMIPTFMRFQGNNTTYEVTTETLAIYEAPKWYFVAVDQQQSIENLVAAYPEFENVSFPTPRIETKSN